MHQRKSAYSTEGLWPELSCYYSKTAMSKDGRFLINAQNKTLKKSIPSNGRPVCRALCTLLLCFAALWAVPRSARAQLYVNQDANPSSQLVASGVGEYNAATGAAINANFISGLNEPLALAVSANTLYVADIIGAGGTIRAYNAGTGAVINANFITGLDPSGIAVSVTPSSWRTPPARLAHITPPPAPPSTRTSSQD